MAREIPFSAETHGLEPGPGLWYVDRDGKIIYRLDAEPDSIESMSKVERYVLRAYVDYVLDKLDKYAGER